MVTFLFAFSYECFISSNLAAIWTTAAGWIAIAILVVWTIITGWEGGETSSWMRMRDRVRAFLSRENDDDDGGVDITVDGGASATVSEKESLRRWWTRIRQHSHLPFAHSGDRPMSMPELREVSSRV